MKINREWYNDKVKACWIGKSIGGTIGGPYEGKREILDVKGFSTPKGQPLPNDDLDLQLVWLCAVEERGIRNITPNLLAEYWLSYITPPWSEYGIGKANLKMGLLPPYSGEYENSYYKHSNGAWIRTEIWACLFPGFPELSVRYAYADASVDHGLGEGTYAAMFVAALESCAFFENDLRKLINAGLSFIPETSRVAQCVKLACEMYDNNAELFDIRNALVESTKDLGWFMAPANVGFVVLGLLSGEGDFKKSMLNAVNCGDDTDCTAGTVGAILGIMGGNKAIPGDWAEYIGDSILSVAIDLSYRYRAKSCTELTRRVYELMPSAMKAYEIYTEYTDGENERATLPDHFKTMDFPIPNTGCSFDLPDMIHTRGRVEFNTLKAESGKEIKLDFIFNNMMFEPEYIQVKLDIPEGWTVDRKEFNMYLSHTDAYKDHSETVHIVPDDNIKTSQKITVEISRLGRPTGVIVPIVVLG